MNVHFLLDFSAPSAIRGLLVTCMAMAMAITMTSQARLSTDPTGVSNSIGDDSYEIINVIQGEVLNFQFFTSNPSALPAEISNFKLLVDDAPSDAASFVKLAEGGFRVQWTASVPLDYPNKKLLQCVAVRDTTSQETITLGWVDVAEWEGMVAGVRIGDFTHEGTDYQYRSHYSGKSMEPDWLVNSNGDVWSWWYRGPKRMVLLDGNGGNTGAIAQITDSARYPFFIFTGTSSTPRLVDVSDPLAYPDKGTWCQNFLSAPVSVKVPASATISPGELKLVPFPAIDPRDSFNMVVNEASYQDSNGKHGIFETMMHYLDGGRGRSMHLLWFIKQGGRDAARGHPIFLPLGATITPYRAGGLADPGLPLNLPSFPPSPYEPSLLPIQSEQWHQVVLKVGPEVGATSDGMELRLGSGDKGDGAPQLGISIQVSSPGGLAPLAIPADGKIQLATGSDLYQRLISPKGLTIFIKRDPSVDQLHHLSLNLMPKANSRSTGHTFPCAALDLLPVEVRDGDRTLTSLSRDEDPWKNANIQKQVADESIAWITGNTGAEDTPEMPKLNARIVGGPASMNVRWRFECEYRRGNGYRQAYVSDFTRPEDKIGIPKRDGSDYTEGLPASQEWKIYEHPKWIQELNENGFFGGLGKVFLKLKDQPEIEVCRFRIGGRNPDEAVAKSYINSKAGSTYWYAYAVAKHETFGRVPGRFYNQFYTEYQQGPIGDNSVDMGLAAWAESWPLYNLDRGRRKDGTRYQNGPGGYGMFQLTLGPKTPSGDQTSEGFITRAQIWNWQENTNRAIKELEGKLAKSQTLKNGLETGFPDWGSLPNYKRFDPLGSIIATNYNGMYNGDGGDLQFVKVNGRNTLSCWSPEKSGSGSSTQRRWQFRQNDNHYVEKVEQHLE